MNLSKLAKTAGVLVEGGLRIAKSLKQRVGSYEQLTELHGRLG
jgi:hypothetical protein